MSDLGVIDQCWRYPVKSLQGGEVDHLDIGVAGVAGDRAFALIDVESGRLLSAKRLGGLLMAAADDRAITLPDGSVVPLDDPTASAQLSSWLGRAVRLETPGADTAVSYEMTFHPPDDDAELVEIPAPPGTFLDLAPIHLVTTATLQACAAARPDLDWSVRRFRPNLVLRVDGPIFVEDEWLGRSLRVGAAVLHIDQPTVRCAMPLRAQPGLDREAGLFAAMGELHTAFPNHLGAYVSVVEPGTVAVGDAVGLV